MARTSDLDGVFDALADPTRRRIVELLRRRPHRAGELTERLSTTAPTMSRHLRVLLERGIVVDERPAHDARLRLFHLNPKPFASLTAWADQMQAHWNEQLGSFRKHVEKTAKGRRM